MVSGHDLGELDNRALRRAIRGAPGRSHTAELRADEDDAAPASLDHDGQAGLADEIGPGQVHAQHPLPHALLELRHSGRRIVGSRAEEQHVETTEHLDGPRRQRLCIRRLGHVGAYRRRLAAAFLRLGGGGPRALLVDVGAEHVRACPREAQRGGTPDALGGTHDHRALAVEAALAVHHAPPGASHGISAACRASNASISRAYSMVRAISSCPLRRACLRNGSTSKRRVAPSGAVRVWLAKSTGMLEPGRSWSWRRRSATISVGRTTASTPFLKQFSKKMSPNEGPMTQRNPEPMSAHTAASREEPQPKFSAVTRIFASRKGAWFRMKSPFSEPSGLKRTSWKK